MKEIKIKKYNTIEDMNFNYNVLIEYKNRVNITKEQFDSINSYITYLELIKEYGMDINREKHRLYLELCKILDLHAMKDNKYYNEDYITKTLEMYIINNYIKNQENK